MPLNLLYKTSHGVFKKGHVHELIMGKESLSWQEIEDTPLTSGDPPNPWHICLMWPEWSKNKEDVVNLGLQEFLVRRQKESLSLSGLQLALRLARQPDNVFSSLQQ